MIILTLKWATVLLEPLYDVQMAKADGQVHGVVISVFKEIRESVGKTVRYDTLCGKPLSCLQMALAHCLDNGVAAGVIPLVNAQPPPC